MRSDHGGRESKSIIYFVYNATQKLSLLTHSLLGLMYSPPTIQDIVRMS